MSQDLPRVLITHAIPQEHVAPLVGKATLVFGPDDGRMMPPSEVFTHAPLDAIICGGELRVDAALLDALPGVKIVANVANGFDNFALDLMATRGVWATNTPDAFTECTADATIGLLLAAARHITRGDRYVRTGQWEHDGFRPVLWEGMLLPGKTLGIIGYGKIGKAVEKRARAFDMNVIHTRRTPSDDPNYRSLDDLLAESDVVSLHTPLNDDSKHLLDARRLASMRRGAIVVNMARGKCVDEQALVDSLKLGHLAGAGLDVFENEPAVHPELMSLDNVALAPHVGGSTMDSRRSGRLLSAENVLLVLAGQRPKTPLNEPM